MLAAPIPRDMVFDAGQRDVYRTPQNLESMFAGHAAPDIRADYVERVNNMLCEMYDAFSVPGSPARLFFRWTDVVFVGLKIKNNTLTLDDIAVRPCFNGQNMLAIVVYQLLLIAWTRGDVERVVVATCVPATLNALKRRFGEHVVFSNEMPEGALSCSYADAEFSNLAALRGVITAQTLGIKDKIQRDTLGPLTLRADGFPTSDDLNSEDTVNKTFKKPPPNPFRAILDREIARCTRMLGATPMEFYDAENVLQHAKAGMRKTGCRWDISADYRRPYLFSTQYGTWFAALDVTDDAFVRVRWLCASTRRVGHKTVPACREDECTLQSLHDADLALEGINSDLAGAYLQCGNKFSSV